ncbi:MAG: sigma-70 family RNA polymerase sigma factor [Clostridia bacterium]|nr:sigma-70 family RNA polymerase sigma factor [Clostridia bacterium]
MDDSALVDMFLERDESAVAFAREKYGARLRRIAFNVLGDAGAAEECESDAYLEAWNRIPPHEPREYLFAFLAKIVRARALDRVRAQSAKKRGAAFTELTAEIAAMLRSGDDPQADVERKELSAAVGRFVNELPDEKRRVFVSRYWYMEPISDIAERYGMRPEKVKSMLFRLRAALRKQLEREELI